MSHFYITIPCDGCMDIFPRNTAANFKTRLPSPISLVGEWDVALYEIHYKRLWYTIQAIDAEIGYEVKRAEGETITYRTFLYQGYYASIEDIVSTLNTIYGRLKTTMKLERVPLFSYNSRLRKIVIELQPGDSLKFKPKLAAMLGIIINPVQCGNESRNYHSDAIVNVDGFIHTLYVYCNIVEPMPDGGIEAPLLRIVGVDAKQGEIVRKTNDNPMYVPVRVKRFDTVEIDIKSNTGEPVPFQYGKSEVILHFRKQNSQSCPTFT